MSVQSGITIKSGFKVNSNLFISLDSGGHVIGADGLGQAVKSTSFKDRRKGQVF